MQVGCANASRIRWDHIASRSDSASELDAGKNDTTSVLPARLRGQSCCCADNKMNRLLPTLSLTLVAAAVALSVVNGRFVYRRATLPPSVPVVHANNTRMWTATSSQFGRRDATVKIVEFSDYECHACRALSPRFQQLLERHPQQISLTVRHYPLAGHFRAPAAAIAAICAGSQHRFPSMHERLFAAATASTPEWTVIAQSVQGIDTAQFRTCLTSPAALAQLDADIALAQELGVVVTPTLLINNELYAGTPHDLERIVKRHLTNGGRPN